MDQINSVGKTMETQQGGNSSEVRISQKNDDRMSRGEENNRMRNPLKWLPTCGSLYRFNWLFIALISSCMYAVVAICTSSLEGEVDPLLVAWTRAILSTVIAAIIACYDGSSLIISSKTELRFHMVQSIITAVTLFAQFYAYQHMPASDAHVILYCYVLLAGVFGRFIYNEPFGVVEFITVGTAAVGIVLVSRPSFLFGSVESDVTSEVPSVIPPLVAVLGAVGTALMAVHARAMEMRNITGMSLMFYSMLFSSVILAVPVTSYNHWQSFLTVCVGSRIRLLINSIAGFLALSLFNYAVMFENTVYVSLVVLCNIPIIFFVSVIFFGYISSWTSVMGMVIILGSCAFVSLKRIKNYRDEKQNEVVLSP